MLPSKLMYIFIRCDVNLLLAALCTRTIQTREGNIVKALDSSAAVANRDTLAKTIYARLFDWYYGALVVILLLFDGVLSNSDVKLFLYRRLVDRINKSVGQDKNSQIQIGVLDIYGFECFEHNRYNLL